MHAQRRVSAPNVTITTAAAGDNPAVVGEDENDVGRRKSQRTKSLSDVAKAEAAMDDSLQTTASISSADATFSDGPDTEVEEFNQDTVTSLRQFLATTKILNQLAAAAAVVEGDGDDVFRPAASPKSVSVR